jgi:hypothetical protein
VSLVSAQDQKPSNYDSVVIAHATLMGAAFVLFMPLGVFLIRLTSFKGLVWVHAGIQVFAYIVALAAFGLGAWMATVSGQWKAGNGHPIIGTIVIGLLIIQPVLGYVHHVIYVKEHRRTFWITGHIWYGRALLILAVINGGLGLQLSDNTVKGEIAYGVIAGVMFLLYVAVLAISYGRKSKGLENETGEKMVGGPKSEKSDEEMTDTRNNGTYNSHPTGSPIAGSTAKGNGPAYAKQEDVEKARNFSANGAIERPRTGPVLIEHATAGYDAPLLVRNV